MRKDNAAAATGRPTLSTSEAAAAEASEAEADPCGAAPSASSAAKGGKRDRSRQLNGGTVSARMRTVIQQLLTENDVAHPLEHPPITVFSHTSRLSEILTDFIIEVSGPDRPSASSSLSSSSSASPCICRTDKASLMEAFGNAYDGLLTKRGGILHPPAPGMAEWGYNILQPPQRSAGS